MISGGVTSGKTGGDTRASRWTVRFVGDVNGPSVKRILRAVTYVYLGLLGNALAVAIFWPHVRSWTGAGIAFGLMALFGGINAVDFRRLRRGDMAAFTPHKALAEVWLATAA